MYTSTEPCAMCAGSVYWVGVRRVVYGLSERELLALTGFHEGNPTFDLPCRTVFAADQLPTEVIGPMLTDEAMAVHAGFWA
jgi:tRNA(Arg) A34 adenosine deaminase TadA